MSKDDETPKTMIAAEQMTVMEVQEKLSRIAKEIESILVRENLTWGDWGEIVEMFSRRIGKTVSVTKITIES